MRMTWWPSGCSTLTYDEQPSGHQIVFLFSLLGDLMATRLFHAKLQRTIWWQLNQFFFLFRDLVAIRSVHAKLQGMVGWPLNHFFSNLATRSFHAKL
jgi:hypothetical protein